MFCPSCGKEIADDSQFCLACGSAVLTTPKAANEVVTGMGPENKQKSPWRNAIVVLVCLVGVALLVFGPLKGSRIAALLRSPRTEMLTSGPTVVKAGHVRYFKFEVDTNRMKDVRVVGTFRTSGGLGNDIQAVIAGEIDFQNWINDHSARLLYGTERVTAGEIDTPILTSGTYYFGLNNRFSLISDKTVEAYVQLKYTSY